MRRYFTVLLILLMAVPAYAWIHVGNNRGVNVVQLPPPAGANRVLENALARNQEDGVQRILETDQSLDPASSTVAADRHTAVLTGWTNPQNAYATTADTTYATIAPTKNTTRNGDFGFAALSDEELPVGATITSVVIEVYWKVSVNTSIATLGARIYNNTTALGTETVVTDEPLTAEAATVSVTSGITEADLKTAGQVKVRVRASRGNSKTAFTASLDYVKMTVNYME